MVTLEQQPNIGEVIYYNINKKKEDDYSLAYVVNKVDNTYYLYVDNQLICVKCEHKHIIDIDCETEYDEYYESESILICNYVIIPEADYILKRD